MVQSPCVVYKARHRRMDRLVAIKVLPAGVVQDASAVARFEREVKAAARLQHPNIVAAYDAAEAEDVHFLVMEYVEGTDLAALVRQKGPLGVDRAVDCVLQAARGLDYAHRHGVVHRDIKPGNLLVDGEGVVKVLDMGLARFEVAEEADLTELTGRGQIMGTIDYMAPEQALDTRHADARADVYALGMTLWYLLTGRSAYVGENALARLLAHREQPIPSLRGDCPAVTPELEAIFLKMVAKRPEDRYQTMAAVIAALEDGLPRPSSIRPGTGQASGTRERAGNTNPCDPTPGAVAGVALAAPATDPTLTLNTAEFDTDPNTEQSLDISASALLSRPPLRGRKLAVGAAFLGLAAIAAAAIVIRVQTDKGEIVVESETGGISVGILRNGEAIKEDWQIHAGADNRWVVQSGTVNIKLPANLQGEFTLDQDTARLVRDGKILVKITRKKKSGSSTVAAEDRDRAAAEWVLAHKGFVQFKYEVGSSHPLGLAKEIDELPVEPFKLCQVHLWGAKDLRGTDLACLEGLRRVLHVQLGDTTIDAEAIRPLAKIPHLQILDIDGTRIKLSEIVGLAGARKLEWLSLSAKQNDDAYAGLMQLRGLRQLALYGASGDDIKQLGEVKQLRTLWLPDAGSPDEHAIAKLQAANPFCRVLIGDKKDGIRAVGPDPIAELARRLRAKGIDLETIDFPHGERRRVLSDAEIGSGDIFSIVAITLPENILLDDLDWLTSLDRPLAFRALRAVGADHYAAALADQSLVNWVILRDSDLTDAGLDCLKVLPSPFEIDVRGTKVTAAGIESLREALPDCTIFWDPPASAIRAAVDRERAAAQWVLAQGGTIRCWTADGKLVEAKTAAELPAGQFEIHHVNLWGCTSVASADLDRFVGLPRLTHLFVARTQVDGDAIARIQKMPRLETLHVNGSRIQSSDLGGLGDLERLCFIWLRAPDQVDDDWDGLKRLSRLRQLFLEGRVSADSLRALGKLSQLRAVYLLDDDPPDERAVADLQRANPFCRVLFGKLGDPRAAGRDRVAELARRLRAKGVPLEMSLYSGEPYSAKADESDPAEGKAVNLSSISLPVQVSLDEEDLQLLDAPAALVWFGAGKAKGADRYAAAISKQRQLSGVAFWQSDLTDAGLEHIKHLPALKSLDVQDTKVTAAGVESLRKVLPDCKIIWNAPPSPAPAPRTADRERAAAEWVLERGGKVAVIQDGKHTLVDRPADLPVGKLSLYTVVLYGCRQVRDDDLNRFAGLDGIWDLHVANTPIGNDAVPAIARMRGLEQLKLGATRLTTSALAGLRDLPKLDYLSISADTQVDDQWEGLQRLPFLRTLQVFRASAGDLRRLADVRQLRSIALSDAADVDAAALAELHAKNPQCRVIVGEKPPRVVGDDPQRIIYQRLQKRGAKLVFGYWPDGSGEERLHSTDRPIRVYGITLPTGGTLSDDELRLCDSLVDIGAIVAPGAIEADRVAAALGEQANFVRNLQLPNSDLTDAGLAGLAALPMLHTLDVRRSKVTSAGIEAFKKRRPDCNVRWTEPPATNVPVADKDRAAAEWIIAQGGFVCFIPSGGAWTLARSRAELPSGGFEVVLVHHSGDGSITNADLEHLVGLRKLCVLQLSNTGIDRGALETLAEIPSLEALELAGTQVKSSQLAPLGKLPRLHLISLQAGDQIDDDYAGLAELPQLRRLTLFAASPADVRLLGKLKQLRTLWLRDTAMDERAVDDMRQANPLCRVLVGQPPQPLRPLGRDPVGELARRLHHKNAGFRVGYLPDGPTVAVKTDDDVAPGKAFEIPDITLPASASLDDEEVAWLSCPCPLYEFRAERSKGADRYAAALSSQPLLSLLHLTDSDLTDAGLAQLRSLRSLSELDVRGTQVTRPAVDELHAALPACRIVSDHGTFEAGPKDGK